MKVNVQVKISFSAEVVAILVARVVLFCVRCCVEKCGVYCAHRFIEVVVLLTEATVFVLIVTIRV
jgi:hypothetical protein